MGDATKITNVIDTCMRDRRDLVRDGKKMRVNNETQVATGGSRRDKVTVTENKCRSMDFI